LESNQSAAINVDSDSLPVTVDPLPIPLNRSARPCPQPQLRLKLRIVDDNINCRKEVVGDDNLDVDMDIELTCICNRSGVES
jgi:hypothetical protein